MEEYVLENEYLRVKFIDIGATLIELTKKQNETNYVLHYQDKRNYPDDFYYFGTVGRIAGRVYPPVYKGRPLDTNEGRVQLHGGKAGLHKKHWFVKRIDATSYCLEYVDTESVYEPMYLKIIYSIEKNKLKVRYIGEALSPTVCNLTNHAYFNLNKDKTLGIAKHWLKLPKTSLQLVDNEFIPTGKLDDMKDEQAKFDFSRPKQINKAFEQGTELSKFCADGIDLAYVFDQGEPAEIFLASEDRKNALRITSDQEACVIYTLNKVERMEKINNGIWIYKHAGITFEMQRRPNYLQQVKDPLTKKYRATTVYEVL